MNNVLASILFCGFLLPIIAPGQAATPTRDQIYAALTGSWTGQLEYRDFQSNERVMLPTWLEVRGATDHDSVVLAYTYDDGPTKTVTETSTITIDPEGRKFTIRSDRDHSSDVYEIQEASTGKHGILLTLGGHGKENDKPVEVRIRVEVDRNLYRFEKETKAIGDEFRFRDGYVMTRREPSSK